MKGLILITFASLAFGCTATTHTAFEEEVLPFRQNNFLQPIGDLKNLGEITKAPSFHRCLTTVYTKDGTETQLAATLPEVTNLKEIKPDYWRDNLETLIKKLPTKEGNEEDFPHLTLHDQISFLLNELFSHSKNEDSNIFKFFDSRPRWGIFGTHGANFESSMKGFRQLIHSSLEEALVKPATTHQENITFDFLLRKYLNAYFGTAQFTLFPTSESDAQSVAQIGLPASSFVDIHGAELKFPGLSAQYVVTQPESKENEGTLPQKGRITTTSEDVTSTLMVKHMIRIFLEAYFDNRLRVPGVATSTATAKLPKNPKGDDCKDKLCKYPAQVVSFGKSKIALREELLDSFERQSHLNDLAEKLNNPKQPKNAFDTPKEVLSALKEEQDELVNTIKSLAKTYEKSKTKNYIQKKEELFRQKYAKVIRVSRGVQALVSNAVGAAIRGGSWGSLNNETAAAAVETALSVIAKKMTEHLMTCAAATNIDKRGKKGELQCENCGKQFYPTFVSDVK
jgi:hypothetical protein